MKEEYLLTMYRIIASIVLLLALVACDQVPVGPDNTDPTVSISSPSANSVATDSLIVTVVASDNVGVVRVEIFLSTRTLPVAVDSVAPYIITIPLADLGSGALQFFARATDAAGNFAVTATVPFTAQNTPGLKFLGQIAINGSARDVVAFGTTAYVAAGAGGIVVLDISNVMVPYTITQYNNGDFVSGVALQAQTLYAAAGDQGILALSTANADTLVAIARLITSGINALQVAIQDSMVSIAAGTGGLIQVNASAADTLIELGKFDASGDIRDVVLIGSYAYTAEGAEGMRVIDISVPSALSAVFQYVPSIQASDLFVNGNFVFLADGIDGVSAFNATLPAAPIYLSTFTSGASMSGVSGADQWVFVAAGDVGVQVINAANPGALAAASNGTFITRGFAYKVTAHNGYILVADGDFLTILKYVP